MWFWIVCTAIVALGFVVFFGAPYVPSRRRDIRLAFRDLYPLTKHDVLVDLGSGDGVVLREAARLGAKAVGFELNPIFLFISRMLSGGDERIAIHMGNMWKVRLPQETTVVYAFVVSRDIGKLKHLLQQEANRLKRPVKLICYGIHLSGKTPARQVGAHFLYDFLPLQRKET